MHGRLVRTAASLALVLAGAAPAAAAPPGEATLVQDITGFESATAASVHLGQDLLFLLGNAPSPWGWQLWRTDGTSGGTDQVSDLGGSGISRFSPLVEFGGHVYFAADQGGLYGSELHRSDGTAAGTELFVNINPDSGGDGVDHAERLVEFKGHLYFAADDGDDGVELWRTNGTEAGTVQMADLNDDPGGSSDPRELTVAGDKLFFIASTDGVNPVLFATGGTQATTLPVKGLGGSGAVPPDYLTALGSGLLFTADDGTSGNELWYSDGTAAGTTMVIPAGQVKKVKLKLSRRKLRTVRRVRAARKAQLIADVSDRAGNEGRSKSNVVLKPKRGGKKRGPRRGGTKKRTRKERR